MAEIRRYHFSYFASHFGEQISNTIIEALLFIELLIHSSVDDSTMLLCGLLEIDLSVILASCQHCQYSTSSLLR